MQKESRNDDLIPTAWNHGARAAGQCCQRRGNSPELRARDALFEIADGVERDFPVGDGRARHDNGRYRRNEAHPTSFEGASLTTARSHG